MSKVLAVFLALFTVPFTGIVVLAGVLWLDGGSASATHTSSVAVGDPAVVTVRVESGFVLVRQGRRGVVTLIEKDSVHGLSGTSAHTNLQRLTSKLRATAGGATVEVPGEFPGLQDLNLEGPLGEQRDVTVDIPPGASLRLDSGPGVIRLSHLSGPVDVSGSAGLVALDRFVVSGASRLRLTNGGIAGSILMAGGSLDAAVVSGGIQVAILNGGPGTRLQATAANGTIDLPRDSGIALQKFGSSESAAGVIDGGAATSGSLTFDTVNGVIGVSTR
jgi:hypothetical protein